MRALAVFAALGWLMSQPWQMVLCFVIAVAVGGYVMLRLHAAPDRRGGRMAGIDHYYVSALETMVADAEAEMETLRGEIERLRSAAASEPDPRAALYHKVGLVPGAPGWLITAARKAYRSALHPDRHPAHRKQEADRRFKLAEATFEAIEALR